MRKLVVLPAPLGPSRPTTSPWFDLEVDAVDDLAAAVPFLQPADFAAGACARSSLIASSADRSRRANRPARPAGRGQRIHFIRSK